jgi:hypothetical protein
MTQIVPSLILTPFANAGDQTVIPPTDPNGFVNFSTGYSPDYEINLASGDPSAKAVERGIQNWLFNQLTTAMQCWQTENRPPWYSGFPGGYAHWAEVMYPNSSGDPVPYRSLVDGNVTTPGQSVNWEYIQGSGEMIANIPMPSGGPSGPTGELITQATDFNTLTSSGTFQYQSDTIVAGSPNTPQNGGNQGLAGMLEVMTWTNSTYTYVVQRFIDRSGMAYLRGASNGSWSTWKIWANSFQYVVGEIRLWSGAATDTAVQAAFGPGWHVCNGNNGTPNLVNQFVPGAGTSSSTVVAPGATGGASTVTLTSTQLPSHNHVINISDPTHNHGITQTPHGHSISDPGHAHGVYDPGHAHGYITGNVAGGNSGPGAAMAANGMNGNVNWTGTQGSGTGIGIYANGTGIGINTSYANVSNNAAYTGISATSNNTGTGSAFSILPPYYALAYVMYTGH